MGVVSLLCKCWLDFAVEQGSVDCKSGDWAASPVFNPMATNVRYTYHALWRSKYWTPGTRYGCLVAFCLHGKLCVTGTYHLALGFGTKGLNHLWFLLWEVGVLSVVGVRCNIWKYMFWFLVELQALYHIIWCFSDHAS